MWGETTSRLTNDVRNHVHSTVGNDAVQPGRCLILGEYSANILRLKSPTRSDFGRKKNFPRPHKLAVCCVTWQHHEQFAGRHRLLRSAIPVLSRRGRPVSLTSFLPLYMVLQRQTCSVCTRELYISGVQLNFGILHSVPLDLPTPSHSSLRRCYVLSVGEQLPTNKGSRNPREDLVTLNMRALRYFAT